jgi:transcriptional regulator with XRE-family HTH domain
MDTEVNRHTPDLASLLVQCRADRNLTIDDLAKELQLSAGAVSNIERGIAIPRRMTRVKIETYLRNQGYLKEQVA